MLATRTHKPIPSIPKNPMTRATTASTTPAQPSQTGSMWPVMIAIPVAARNNANCYSAPGVSWVATYLCTQSITSFSSTSR